ncbi:MAG TPA: WhiB family transcriptional regulator [Candidatus Saccharibacteria bacterium]|nr:WhiB family transcriptional regulator [Candidatus Saccharibacteria bacterium]
MCSSCESRVECLDHALITDEGYGIWGGFSPRERRKIQKQGLSAQEAIDQEDKKQARRKTA